jgi:hypothetical protein
MPARMQSELQGRGFESRRLHNVGAVAQLVEHVFGEICRAGLKIIIKAWVNAGGITWFKEGSKGLEGSTPSLRKQSFILPNLSPGSSGRHECDRNYNCFGFESRGHFCDRKLVGRAKCFDKVAVPAVRPNDCGETKSSDRYECGRNYMNSRLRVQTPPAASQDAAVAQLVRA